MRIALSCAVVLTLAACAAHKLPELKAVDFVDIERFMGDWYVVANIPTWIETEAFNAVERYELDDDGTIRTTFTFNKGALDGPMKTYTPRGFVREGTGNAIWGMRFIWPIKADYRIIYLDPEYETTVIGRQKRDYVWIMARKPTLDDATWQRLEEVVAEAGYDVGELRRVPHDAKESDDG
jgi:apolipoprotein D and lipocalin family protein